MQTPRGGLSGEAVTTKLREIWYNMCRPMTGEKTLKTHRARYSAAYPTGREFGGVSSDVGDGSGSAILSSSGSFSLFKAGGDTIRFATSPRLVRYTRVKRWEDGYLEVGVDYGNGEVEDYIDVRQILDNLYYDTNAFLKNIKKVEVRYD